MRQVATLRLVYWSWTRVYKSTQHNTAIIKVYYGYFSNAGKKCTGMHIHNIHALCNSYLSISGNGNAVCHAKATSAFTARKNTLRYPITPGRPLPELSNVPTPSLFQWSLIWYEWHSGSCSAHLLNCSFGSNAATKRKQPAKRVWNLIDKGDSWIVIQGLAVSSL